MNTIQWGKLAAFAIGIDRKLKRAYATGENIDNELAAMQAAYPIPLEPQPDEPAPDEQEHEQLKLLAIELAKEKLRSIAIVYLDDDGEWKAGSHTEKRYLTSRFHTNEIWVCDLYDTPIEWRLYFKRGEKSVSSRRESGATGELGRLLDLFDNMKAEPSDQEGGA